MKVVCCWMYLIGKYGFPPELPNVYKGLREVSDLGFNFIELEVVGKDNLLQFAKNKSDLAKLCNDLGIEVSNFAVLLPDIFNLQASKREDALALFEKGVETAKYFNSANIWIDSFLPPVRIKSGKTFDQGIEFGTQVRVEIPQNFDWCEYWNIFITSIRKCSQIAEQYAMPLLIEPRTGEIISNSDALLRVIERVDNANLGAILDTAHLHAAKEILPLTIEKMSSNIRYVHVADNDGRENRHLVPGDGTIDWEEVFNSLKKVGYDGYFAVDLEKLTEYDQSYLKCKQFLEDFGKKYSF